MDNVSSVAHRAALAVKRTRALDEYLDELTPDQPEWRLRAGHARTLAAILGVDPANVIVTRDPVRGNRYPAYVITVYDHTADTTADDVGPVWRFAPDIVDGSYLILGACRACGREITTHVVASLVDLGRVLDGSGIDALSAPAAHRDPGHDTGCPLYHPTDT
ncbi:MAG TPA: hypothetical protein VF892_17700 [Pseudonocardiaceae bacterium]